MIAKCLALVASALCCVSATEAPPTYYVAFPMVAQVKCLGAYGTAFRAEGKWISVDHVTRMGGCFIGDMPADAKAEGSLDFSVIGPANLRGFKVDCEGFKAGEIYWAIGYAHGYPVQQAIRLEGTGKYADNGMAALVGWPTVIPGQSGGAIISEKTGKVVGSINMFNRVWPISLSQELKGTSLCKRNAGASAAQ